MNFISTFEELNKLYEEAAREDEVTEACSKKITEDAEEEIADEVAIDEEPVVEEEPEVEEVEPKKIIIGCAKCGALAIKDEADMIVDEESDLVNVEDKCAFCEETAGFEIIGTLLPYEVAEDEEIEIVDDEVSEDEVVDEDEIIDEDLGDLYRKVFDKPASGDTQQAWEDELNGDMGEISDKRRKHLERKFAQQRDWEARHPEAEVK